MLYDGSLESGEYIDPMEGEHLETAEYSHRVISGVELRRGETSWVCGVANGGRDYRAYAEWYHR